MAFTRLIDDPCEVKMRTVESTGTLAYLLEPGKYYHKSPCLIQQGIVGGNSVSLYKGNMVDLESDLSGRTRAQTKCSGNKFLPGTVVQGRDRKGSLVHLPTCKIINYHPKVKSTGFELNYPKCNTLGYTARPYTNVKKVAPAWGISRY
jgi:hypothetical protein